MVIILEVYNTENKQKPLYTSEKVVVPKGSKEICIPYTMEKTYKGKTDEEKQKEDRERKDIQIFFKIKPVDTNLFLKYSNEEFENNLLTITNRGDIVEAYFCNSDDTEKQKFIEFGKVAHLKIYATNMKGREVEVLFFTRDKFLYSKNTTQNELTWKLWSEIKTHNIKGEPFHSTKGKIDNKGELLVALDTSKCKLDKANIIAVFKIKGKEGKEKGAYIREWYSLILHSYPQLTKLAENEAAVKVGGLLGIGEVERVELEKKECICKQYDLIWGNKVSCEFRKKIVEIAKEIGLPQEKNKGANWLMAVIALETATKFSPTIGTFGKHKDDSKSGYVGLIQFGKAAAESLDIKRSQLIKMSAEEQLTYVKAFFQQKMFENKLKTMTDLYLAVNYPIACGQGANKNYVVYDDTNAAYDSNPIFKREKDEYFFDEKGKKHYYKGRKGKSYIWEFEEAVNELYEKGEKNRATYFSCLGKGELFINEFGLVQVTKIGNPYIINYGTEDTYSYIKKDGSKSVSAKHGDDWIKPEKASAISDAVYNLVKEFPNQKLHINDCSAYNPSYNLGHSKTGAHSRGEAFDCKFFTVNGEGTNDINSLTVEDIKINSRFIELLKETKQFTVFYADNGKIPGTKHASNHKDHLHVN
ncbi:hypothetical protein [Capnocytophaga catalasegens]|uniref:Uncharacterized protein n=2 Tax=Capnocytophaga catalasegens TaxID=1004260 RepID=A0ABQ4VMA5_9FLAO|nr:hypothetical protein [Capnocytophaga catalasegens]GJM52632.1 hypothetical protein RCZ16_09490 [Capnocytophaga catalasegens]